MYIGVKSNKKIQELPVYLYGRNLQVQLFKALVAQICYKRSDSQFFGISDIDPSRHAVPSVLFCIHPPFFEVDCSALSNFQTFVYALYPAIDSLPSLISYRKTVRGKSFVELKHSKYSI